MRTNNTQASVTEPSDTSEDWELVEEGHRAASIMIQWRRSIRVYPWFRFAKAEGDNSSVDLEFGDDVITVNGNRLHLLLRAIAEHRVLRLIQPTENEAKFNVRGENAVRQIGRPTITQILIDGKTEQEHNKAEYDLVEDEDYDDEEEAG
jgi:hypothetical protein